jgi:hypothetical protein
MIQQCFGSYQYTYHFPRCTHQYLKLVLKGSHRSGTVFKFVHGVAITIASEPIRRKSKAWSTATVIRSNGIGADVIAAIGVFLTFINICFLRYFEGIRKQKRNDCLPLHPWRSFANRYPVLHEQL